MSELVGDTHTPNDKSNNISSQLRRTRSLSRSAVGKDYIGKISDKDCLGCNTKDTSKSCDKSSITTPDKELTNLLSSPDAEVVFKGQNSVVKYSNNSKAPSKRSKRMNKKRVPKSDSIMNLNNSHDTNSDNGSSPLLVNVISNVNKDIETKTLNCADKQQGKVDVVKQVPALDFRKLDLESVKLEFVEGFSKKDIKIQNNILVELNKKVKSLDISTKCDSYDATLETFKKDVSSEGLMQRCKLFIRLSSLLYKNEQLKRQRANNQNDIPKELSVEDRIRFDGWRNAGETSDRPLLLDVYKESIMKFVDSIPIKERLINAYGILKRTVQLGFDWEKDENFSSFIEDLCTNNNIFAVNSYFSSIYSECVFLNKYNTAHDISDVIDPDYSYIENIIYTFCTTELRFEFSMELNSRNHNHLEEKIENISDSLREKCDAIKEGLEQKIDKVFYGSTGLSEQQKEGFAVGLRVLVDNVNELVELPDKFLKLSEKVDKTNDLVSKLTDSIQNKSETNSVHAVSLDKDNDIVEVPVSVYSKDITSNKNSSELNPAMFVQNAFKRFGDRVPFSSSSSEEQIPKPIEKQFNSRVYSRSKDFDHDSDPELTDSESKEKKSFRLDAFKANLPTWHGITDNKTPFEFLSKLNNYREYLDKSDIDMIKGVIPFAMSGSAIAWFNLIKSSLETYKQFEEAFRVEFEGFDYKERIRCNLIALRQEKNQLPTIFIQHMNSLIKYGEVYKTEKEAVDLIVSKMHPKWQRELCRYNLKTIVELNSACQEAASFNRKQKDYDNPFKTAKFIPDGDIMFEKNIKSYDRCLNVDPILYREKSAKIFTEKSNETNTQKYSFEHLKFVHDRLNRFKYESNNQFRGKSRNDRFQQNKSDFVKNHYHHNNKSFEHKGQYNSEKKVEYSKENTNKPNSSTNSNKEFVKTDDKPNFQQNKFNYQQNKPGYQQNKPNFQQNRNNFQNNSQNKDNTSQKSQNRSWQGQRRAFCAVCSLEGHSVSECELINGIQEEINTCLHNEDIMDYDIANDSDTNNSSNEDNSSESEVENNDISVYKCIQLIKDTYSRIKEVSEKSDTDLNITNVSKSEVGVECLVEVAINDRKLIAIFDCGANCNVIDYDIYSRLLNTFGLEETSNECMIVGDKKSGLFKTKLYFQIPGQSVPMLFNFYVIKKVPFVLIGTYILEKLKIDILLSSREYVFKKERYPFLRRSDIKDRVNLNVFRVTVEESKINDQVNFEKMIESCKTLCDVSFVDDLKEVLIKHQHIFSELPAIAKGIEFQINFYEGQTPKKLNTYPANPMKRRMIDECIDELIDNKLIRPSDSPCSSPCIVVPKPDGTGRFCVDFRKLNEISKVDSFPLPKIEELITNLGKANYFTVIDLTKGYHQIPIRESDMWKSAFVTHRGLYEYVVMPFGAKNAPACFQRAMNKVLGTSHWLYALVYIDDIIIFSNTMKEHLEHLNYVFSRLSEYNLNVNPKKLQLCCGEFKFLGYVFKHEGDTVKMYPNPKKLIGIRDYPSPTNQKKVSQLVGMLQYYKNFVPNYAKLISPITNLLKKSDAKFIWSADCEANLRTILHFLMEKAVLLVPNFDEKFEIHSDACNDGIAAVLFQRDRLTGELLPISFRSRKLNEAEKKMGITHKECLAVKYGFDKFRFFIEYNHFILVTDHQALQWLMSTKDLSGKLARWAISIQGYDFEIVYRPGVIHERADALSRAPVEDAPKESGFMINLLSQNPVENAPSKSVNDVTGTAINFENPMISNKALIEAQKEDEFCKEILAFIDNKTLPTDKKRMAMVKIIGSDCCVLNNTLMRYIPDWNEIGYDYFYSSFKMVVPESLKQMVIEMAHDHKLGGHLGRDKTLNNILRYYWWFGIGVDVAKYVKTCSVCQLTKTNNEKPAGHNFGYKALRPFDLISIDFIGPLVRATASGNTVLLVILDVYSKIVELCAFRSENSENLVNFVFQTCCRYGFPTSVISDGGPQFISNLFNGLMKRLGVKVYKSPPYVAKCNPVERTNRNIKAYLRAYVSENHRTWDKSLPELMFMLRNIIHVSTGFAPSELMFGRKFHNPLFNRTDFQLAIPETVEDFELSFKETVDCMNNYATAAREMIEKSKIAQKFYVDLKHSDVEFKIGDIVKRQYYSASSAINNKTASLDKKYEGPFKIVAKIAHNVFVLSRVDRDEFYTTVHSNQLFTYNPREDIDIKIPDIIRIPTNRSGKATGVVPTS